MEDTSTCPICQQKMRSLKVLKSPNLAWERICNGTNHSIQIFSDEKTKQVYFLKLSLNPKYSRFLEINFPQNTCNIICLKLNVPHVIPLPSIPELDFPNLSKLKKKISLLITFS